MAPEQALGREVDARTDIYALGMVLYEMASGRRPFREDLPTHLIDDILHKTPEPPKKSDGKPSAFEAVISRCLAKEAADRFQTAKEVMAELEAFGRVVRAKSWGRGGRGGKPGLESPRLPRLR